VDGFTQVYEMIKTSAPKTSKKKRKEDRLIYTPRKQTTCIEIKETLLLTPEIRTAVFSIQKWY
jgi:hypothetical protein